MSISPSPHSTTSGGTRSDELIAALRTIPFGSTDASTRHLAVSPQVQAAASSTINAIRWAAITYGMIFGAKAAFDGSYFIVVSLGICLFFTSWRSVIPLTLDSTDRRQHIAGVIDVAIFAAGLGVSGGPSSPFVYCLLVALGVVAFGWGYRLGAVALVVAWVVMLATHLIVDGAELTEGAAITVAIGSLAVVGVAAFGRNRFIDAEQHRMLLRGRVATLSDANDLLTMLNSVARSLPNSLSQRDTLDSARKELAATFNPSLLCLFEYDEAHDEWTPKLAEGTSAKTVLSSHDLAPHLRQAADGTEPWLVSDLTVGNVRGIDDRSGSGLYTKLVARGSTVGLLGIEHRTPGTYTERDRVLLSGLADILALTLDNARWFGRLRALGAEEERGRIARDLHDRLGQWLTYISFELERYLSTDDGDHPQLRQLHGDVQTALEELRETLRQLRTTISESRPFADVAREHVQRFSDRTGIVTSFESTPPDERLAIPVENELLRILQEALNNVDKHAKASEVAVTWSVSDGTGVLRIVDNGRGFNLDRGVRESAYGLVGMRERADVVGGRLSIESAVDDGTTINVSVGSVPAN